MKVEVTLAALRATARALTPYTRAHNPAGASGLLHLHAHDDLLTLTATTGEETAQVDLPGARADGTCAVPPALLVAALTAVKRPGRGATVTLHLDGDHLDVTVGARPPITVPVHTPTDLPVPAPLGEPAVPLVDAPVVDWCGLLAAVGTAASPPRDNRPDLAVVRLHRDDGAVLVVEATDRYRVHRATLGTPMPGAVEVRLPTDAADRATKLHLAADPTGHIRLATDGVRLAWRTARVRLDTPTGGHGHYPDLERFREQVLTDADISFTVNRQPLQTALDTAVALTRGVRYRRVQLQPTGDGTADLTVHADGGAPVYRTAIAVHGYRGPLRTLTVDPVLAGQAVALLDGPAIAVDAIADGLAVHLAAGDRHALVMQIATH
jgi:hypothetical protein